MSFLPDRKSLGRMFRNRMRNMENSGMIRTPSLPSMSRATLVKGATSLVLISALGLSSASANSAAELCSGGVARGVVPGQTMEEVIRPGADLRFQFRDPVGAGHVDMSFDNFPASSLEITRPSRKLGVVLVTCRTTGPYDWSDAEVLRVIELEPGVDVRDFISVIRTDTVQEGDHYALRVIAIPPDEADRSRLRRVLTGLGAGVAFALGGPLGLATVGTGELLRRSVSGDSDLPFGLEFTLTPSAAAQPGPEETASEDINIIDYNINTDFVDDAEEGAAQEDTASPGPMAPTVNFPQADTLTDLSRVADQLAADQSGEAEPDETAEQSTDPGGDPDEKLLDVLESAGFNDHPQAQPLAPTILNDLSFGPMQPDPEGYFAAPATAPVGSRVPVQITYDDRRTFDNLVIFVDADLPDDALTGPSGRNLHRIRDNDEIHRRAGDWPGTYEVRLRRHAGWDRRVMARSLIELVDIEIDIQVPDEVVAGQEFEVYLNPVMDGHLVITSPDRAPDDLVRENVRRANVIEDADMPGLFTRRAPRTPGEHEVRFHFNAATGWEEQTGRHGRLMARATLDVIDAGSQPDAETDGDTPPEVETLASQLEGLEAQIEALESNLAQVTVGQVDAIRDDIAALGFPALAMLTELLSREQISPQLHFAFTAPQPPAQLAAAPTQTPTQPQTATAAAPAPTQAAPAKPQPATGQPQPAESGTGSYSVTGVASDDVLNVRSGPGADNTIVGMLPPNASGITLTGQSAQSSDGGSWWQISDATLPGGTGWVNARFLTAGAAQAPATAPPASAPDSAQYLKVTGIASNEVLYLRSAPSPDAPIVGMLQPDATEISTTGAQQSGGGTDWVEIRYANAPGGGKAWAAAANLVQMDPRPGILDVAQEFTNAEGLGVFDTFKLQQSITNILHYAQESAFAPGHDLSPLTKAIVAVQAIDGRLPHVRYHLTYGQGEATIAPDGTYDLVDLVEVRRFNLGPARHAETLSVHGADNTADIAEFGEGPDVVWRFAMRPLRGTAADILSASRAEIDAPEADCMGFHCQIAQSIIPHLADWDEPRSMEAPDFSPSYDRLWQGAPSAPAVLDMLALTSRFAETGTGDARWQPIEPRMMDTPGDPFVDVIIEVGLGQAGGAEVMLYETNLRDDEWQSVWDRLGAFGGPGQDRVFISRAGERWPSRQ